MNTFNRIVLIVLCLALVVLALSIITLTWTIPNRTIDWLAGGVQWLDDNDGDLEKTLISTVSAFVGLVALIVLLIELIPRRGPSVRVKDLAVGSATLSAASIGQRIEEAVVQVPHVAEVRADVKSKSKGVTVALDLQVEPEANLATVTDQACQTATEVLTNRLHVTLLRPPTAKLQYRELRLQRGAPMTAPRRAPRPATPPAQPAPATTPPAAAVPPPAAPAQPAPVAPQPPAAAAPAATEVASSPPAAGEQAADAKGSVTVEPTARSLPQAPWVGAKKDKRDGESATKT